MAHCYHASYGAKMNRFFTWVSDMFTSLLMRVLRFIASFDPDYSKNKAIAQAEFMAVMQKFEGRASTPELREEMCQALLEKSYELEERLFEKPKWKVTRSDPHNPMSLVLVPENDAARRFLRGKE